MYRLFFIALLFSSCLAQKLRPAAAVKPSLSEDESHIKEHLKNIADVDTSKMTSAELEFHYFKLHDTDNNDKLDGLELLQALTHSGFDHKDDDGSPSAPIELTLFTDVIDRVLADDDLNNDGYLSYEEYKTRSSAN